MKDIEMSSWVYDIRNAGVLGRVIRKGKNDVKVEFINKHPITFKVYKKNELKFLALD
jgi:hypothetical protein